MDGRIISEFTYVSHDAIRNWYIASKDFFFNIIEKKERRAIAVDETRIKLEDECPLVAIDVGGKRVLAVYISKGRWLGYSSILEESAKVLYKQTQDDGRQGSLVSGLKRLKLEIR